MLVRMTREAILTTRKDVFIPKGFRNENALVEGIAQSCRGRKTAMLTGNYTVRQGPDMQEDDPRLLGREMLLTIELAGRVYAKCVALGVEPPAIVLLPNDIVPGIFQSNDEERAFKTDYRLPEDIGAVLSAHGLSQEPIYFFMREFAKAEKHAAAWARTVRRQLRDGKEKVIVVFESFAQNLASKALARGKAMHLDETTAEPNGSMRILTPADVKDSFSGETMLANTLVSVTQPNGAPFCSFLAATLFREFETLGFERMVNTFVMKEYPCVDKAAAAYRYMYGGKMTIRNIYLDGATVEVDNTIS